MIYLNEKEKYIFVIDTETYAGNFERPMTDYLTGHYGEGSFGEEEAQIFEQEVGDPYEFFDSIEMIEDEHGTGMPTDIIPTPGWFNNGIGGLFKDGDEVEALEDYRCEVKNNFEKAIERLNDIENKLNNNQKYANWTMDDVQSERTRLTDAYQKNIDKGVTKFPAFLSVGIFFSKRPTLSQITLMKSRAFKFAEIQKIKVTGFRLIKEMKQFSYEDI